VSAGPALVDCRGQRCPLPVITLARRLATVEPGVVLRVLADDPAAATDIPAWCRLRGQRFLGTVEVAGGTGYDVQRTG
jgi:tRNA 2-thiouridine synthesizing protein A